MKMLLFLGVLLITAGTILGQQGGPHHFPPIRCSDNGTVGIPCTYRNSYHADHSVWSKGTLLLTIDNASSVGVAFEGLNIIFNCVDSEPAIFQCAIINERNERITERRTVLPPGWNPTQDVSPQPTTSQSPATEDTLTFPTPTQSVATPTPTRAQTASTTASSGSDRSSDYLASSVGLPVTPFLFVSVITTLTGVIVVLTAVIIIVLCKQRRGGRHCTKKLRNMKPGFMSNEKPPTTDQKDSMLAMYADPSLCVVLHRVEEQPQNTPHGTRKKKDLAAAGCNLNIEHTSISDTQRMGQYRPPRPVLVRLHREQDAHTILHHRGTAKHITPYMSQEELTKQKVLRQHRQALVESGVDPSNIQLSPPFLLLHTKLHGYVDSDHCYQTLASPGTL